MAWTATPLAPAPLGPTYERRRPEDTSLYRIVSEHLETFLEQIAADGIGLPTFVVEALRAYLRCGVLAHGFIRLTCTSCRRDRLVGFSCKGRGVCPSCGGKRMAATAARLVDEVFPAGVGVRQWVLTLPYELRFAVAMDAELRRAVLAAFLREVFLWHQDRAWHDGVRGGETGSVTWTQRFGGGLRLAPHFHSLVLSGVFHEPRPGAPPRFHALGEPTEDELVLLVAYVRRRVLAVFRKRGLLDDEGWSDAGLQPAHDSPALLACQAAAYHNARTFGDQAGQSVAQIGLAPQGLETRATRSRLCASQDGFNLHCGVAVGPDAREALERLCRYVARPAISNERLTILPGGDIELRLKNPWRNGMRQA